MDRTRLVTGMNRVAIVTSDLDRFIDFYTEVFELELAFEERRPGLCHAMLWVGPDCLVHAFQMADKAHVHGQPQGDGRGHLDHVALTVADAATFAELTRRLVDRGVSDGQITDVGAAHSVSFRDPDGMHGEIVFVVDRDLKLMHPPRPLATTAC
ncbi:MAG: VOC family protein [Acidimicrobiia bacterium]|nr:VOC family protein [Acidimicrobiia bacterium]